MKVFSIMLLLLLSSCGAKKSSAPTSFKISMGALASPDSFSGGVFIRGIELDKGRSQDFYLTNNESVELVNGNWLFHAVGFQMADFSSFACGSSFAHTLSGEDLSVEINLTTSLCSNLFFSDLIEDFHLRFGAGLICPSTHGEFIAVPGDPNLGTSDFCVMKFEAKNVGGVPKSVNLSAPWVEINQIIAKRQCNSLGLKYHLISNPEWMTIARNIENIGFNWSGGSPSSGVLNRGHSDATPSISLSVGDVNDHYDGTSNDDTAGWEQRRTHTLSNGEVIWDLAGNVWEWVDWTINPSLKAFSGSDGSPVSAYREWPIIDVMINPGDPMAIDEWQAINNMLDSSNGIGTYFAGLLGSGGAAYRGGFFSANTNSGVYALNLNFPASFTNSSLGFRCVYVP